MGFVKHDNRRLSQLFRYQVGNLRIK
jgi:hypothetical protein